MDLIQFEGGDILAAEEPLTVTGLLLPYNEVGRTNVGRFMVEAGSVAIPTDPAVVGINIDHVRQDVVGRAVRLDERAEGVFATIKYADTEEGRAAYTDAINPDGKRRKLSGEFGPAYIKGGKLVPGFAKLWGGAQVEAGAFPSAQVLASDTPDAEVPTSSYESHDESEFTDANGKKWRRVYDSETETVTSTAEDGSTKTTSTSTWVEETTPTDSDGTDKEKEEPPVGAPITLASVPAATTEPRPVDLRQVFAAMATVRRNPTDTDALQVLADLQDITIGGADALPGTGVLRPNWVGQLYDGIPYVREYINLGKLGTDISVGGKEGFKVKRGTSGSPIAGPAGVPNGGDWAGNKTDINSYKGRATKQGSFFRRFAEGNDIGREFFDLPGGAESVEAFLKDLIEDHLYWSDMWALFDLQTSAGIPIAPKTYPTDYPNALGMLLQGILAVRSKKDDGRRDQPTYAIANDEAYEELIYAAGGAEHLPAFVDIVISTASEGKVDGNVQVVQGDTGIYGSASVQVGAQRAVEFDELPGGPLVINALDLARGGVDRAVHGYLQTFPVRDEATVLIGTAPNRATSTAYERGTLTKVSSVLYRTVVAGTSASSGNPTAPAVGSTVVDGTQTLLRLA